MSNRGIEVELDKTQTPYQFKVINDNIFNNDWVTYPKDD